MPIALTPAEQTVYDLLMAGHSVAEICTMTSRSPSTTCTHKSRILKKLGAANVSDLYKEQLKDRIKAAICHFAPATTETEINLYFEQYHPEKQSGLTEIIAQLNGIQRQLNQLQKQTI